MVRNDIQGVNEMKRYPVKVKCINCGQDHVIHVELKQALCHNCLLIKEGIERFKRTMDSDLYE